MLAQVRIIRTSGEVWACSRSKSVADNLREIAYETGIDPGGPHELLSLFDLTRDGRPFAEVIEKRDLDPEDLPVSIY